MPSSADPAPLPYAGGLAPYAPGADAPWTSRRAAHLLRRTGLGAPPQDIARVVSEGARAAVARMVAGAREAGEPPQPEWSTREPPTREATAADLEAFREADRAGRRLGDESVFDEVLGRRHPGSRLREKVALAWHALIPVRRTRQSAHAYDYWHILRAHALGSFRELVREVSTTPAMLVFLDGDANRAGSPNENYARELLELYTMGVTGPDGRPNYTQRDVAELARAFTGWTAPQRRPGARFVPARFDDGDKTVFGVTGRLDASGAVDLIFRARAEAVSLHAARHLYRTFVHAEPNAQVVGEMAERLRRDDFVTGGTIEALLGSRHFFAETTLGALVKSPYEHAAGLIVDIGVDDPASLYDTLRQAASDAGFDRLDPEDVDGWPGGRAWLDTSRLTERWRASDGLIRRARREQELAQETPGADDPVQLVDALAERLFAVPLSAAARAEAVDVLLGGIPAYEWRADARGAVPRIRALLEHFARLPEYQLT